MRPNRQTSNLNVFIAKNSSNYSEPLFTLTSKESHTFIIHLDNDNVEDCVQPKYNIFKHSCCFKYNVEVKFDRFCRTLKGHSVELSS